MELVFKNFAKAGSGVVKLNDLTVISGSNNTGKTYVNYAICSILENMREYFDIGLTEDALQKSVEELKFAGKTEIDISKEISDTGKIINGIEQHIESDIHKYFKLPENHFSEFKLSLKFDEKEIIPNSSRTSHDEEYFGEISCNDKIVKFIFSKNNSKIIKNINNDINTKILYNTLNALSYTSIFHESVPIPFPLTSERSGIALFYKVYDFRNDRLLELLDNEVNKNTIANINKMRSFHALPIQMNMDTIRWTPWSIVENKSFIMEDQEKYSGIISILTDLLDGGSFGSENDSLMYHPKKSAILEPVIPIHAASSSIKSLFLLDVFIKQIANPQHILIVDEPELNLFPNNQLRFARLIARLVNMGVKVLVTTHSDYFIREINNLIMLNSGNSFKQEVMAEYNFFEEEILDYSRVSAYKTSDNYTIEEVQVDKFGIDSELLDSIIIDENKKTRDVRLIVEDGDEKGT